MHKQRVEQATISLPDDPGAERRRQVAGWFMIGAAGVVLLSLALPWISGAAAHSVGPVTTLPGYRYSTGIFVGLMAVALIACGMQALTRPRVRYYVGALVILVSMLIGTLLHVGLVQQDDLERLGVASTDETWVEHVVDYALDTTGVGFIVDEPFASSDRVEGEVGATVALIGEVAALVALAFLWGDDRRRRRAAGLLP